MTRKSTIKAANAERKAERARLMNLKVLTCLETVTGGADDIDIKWYMYTDADGLQTVVSDEMIADHGPESYAGYDMTEVQHIGTSYNAESDYFRLSDGRVALTDLCGLVQYIGDNRDDCADYVGDPDPDYWTR